MSIDKKAVADQMAAYLRHELSLEQLVDWAETALMDAEFNENEVEPVSKVLARLGVSDVRAFGLSWEDCEELLNELGYIANVEVKAA